MKKLISFMTVVITIFATMLSITSCSIKEDKLYGLPIPNKDGIFFVSSEFNSEVVMGASLNPNIVIPETSPLDKPVVRIAIDAFAENSILTEVTIPASVVEICAGAFKDCVNLTKVTFAEGSKLETIGANAFKNCTSLTEIDIPDTVTLIDGDIDYGNMMDHSDIPEFIFYEGAFQGCTSLRSVNFGKNSQLKTIGAKAFDGCTSLKEINIPDSVTEILEGAFNYCTNLEAINCSPSSNLETIGDGAFCGCSALKRIYIANNVKNIQGGSTTVFNDTTFFNGIVNGCSSLESIVFYPDSQLESIDNDVFTDLKSLTSIVIPKNMTSYDFLNELEQCTSVKNIYYLGDEYLWNTMTDNYSNKDVYFYSENTPENEGNFWRYVDGVPTVW